MNAERSAAAIHAYQRAQRRAGTPPPDFSSRVLQPLEVKQGLEQAEGLLEPGEIVQGAGEAIPALGHDETDGRRDDMIDTLERPTTVSVRASEQRLELVDRLGILQSAVDTAFTAQARNSIEKMLCHQLAAAHAAAMNLLGYMPGLQSPRSLSRSTPPAVEIARVGNTAARLIEVCLSAAQVLQKLKTGGTQHVVVQYQQVNVTDGGQAVVAGRLGGGSRRRRRGRKRNG